MCIQGILKISTGDTPYVVFAYAAMVPWMLVSSGIGRCGACLTSNAGIIKKMALAREVFPVAAVLTAVLDSAISFCLLFALLAWFHTPLGWSLLWFPLLVVLGTGLAFGCGMLVAALGTFKHDVLFAVPLLMQLWLLISPIMYPLEQVPSNWRSLYILNPMVGLVESVRAILIRGVAPDPSLLGIAAVGIGMVILVAWPLFRSLSQNIADVL
jgi:lipopolysaccharide transport system permease protein